jgi:hypothetical protein
LQQNLPQDGDLTTEQAMAIARTCRLSASQVLLYFKRRAMNMKKVAEARRKKQEIAARKRKSELEQPSHVKAYLAKKKKTSSQGKSSSVAEVQIIESDEEEDITNESEKKENEKRRNVWTQDEDLQILQYFIMQNTQLPSRTTPLPETHWDSCAAKIGRKSSACHNRFLALMKKEKYLRSVQVALADRKRKEKENGNEKTAK